MECLNSIVAWVLREGLRCSWPFPFSFLFCFCFGSFCLFWFSFPALVFPVFFFHDLFNMELPRGGLKRGYPLPP